VCVCVCVCGVFSGCGGATLSVWKCLVNNQSSYIDYITIAVSICIVVSPYMYLVDFQLQFRL